jgi:hypothetical protein
MTRRALVLGVFLALGVARDSLAQTSLDARSLPLGDGRVSSAPKPGYVFACMTQFRGGGAQHSGDWIHGATWDSTTKIHVRGEIAWADARFSVTTENGERRIAGNGLPVGHTTGIFPVERSDPAFQIDRNPNRIESQQIVFSLPLFPRVAQAPSCVPMGIIGVTLSGVALFNALDAAGRDAVAHEVQDLCNGHPERSGTYHYHGPSPCVPGATMKNTLIGYALDGFGITSMYDENGRELTNADLDECHGRVSRIPWNGGEVQMYHYVMTRGYPYTVGCYRGVPLRLARAGDGPRAGKGPEGGPPRPPAEAIAACAGLSSGEPCRFTSPRGDAVVGTCRSPAGGLACVPERPGKAW